MRFISIYMNKYKNIDEAITAWKNTNRIAFKYPRLKQVSLNGGIMISYTKAIKRIEDCINSGQSAHI